MNSRVEKIKTVILVVLVVSTILLLYFFWTDQSLTDVSPKDLSIGSILGPDDAGEVFDPLTPGDVLVPGTIVISSADGAAALAESGRRGDWERILGCFSSFCADGGILVEEITADQYDEIMTWRSVSAGFDYYLPFGDWCAEAGIQKSSGFENIEALSELSFSEGSPESVFISDNASGKFYRLVGAAPREDFVELLDRMESREQFMYYPAGQIFGEEADNDALIPLSADVQLAGFAYYPEFTAGDTARIVAMARNFFGNSFDFVRKIEDESGALTYMYGYGKRVLIVSPDGTYEYKQDAESARRGTTYFDALKTALGYISRHGGFVTQNGQILKPYLADAGIKSDAGEYEFVFGFEANGMPVVYGKGNPLIVDVAGGSVTYFRRDFITFDESAGHVEQRQPVSCVDILTGRYERMYEELGRPEAGEASRFDAVIHALSGVTYGYYRSNGRVCAAWLFGFGDGRTLAFDLYTGGFLGRSEAEV